jgi:predicted MFS family arabinose efflux permease
VLYETALGVGIAAGPLVGGVLGSISWRGPFFGVALLMAIALTATLVLLPATPRPAHRSSIAAPILALKHRSLATMGLTGLFYNWGFFTLLAYSPFLMELDAIQLGLVFCGWGVLVAVFSVFGAPRLQARFGTARTLYANFVLLALDLAVIAAFTTNRVVVIVAVVVAGMFLGINNTLVTQAVMMVSPVERPVASATYGFVRFIGGGIAPYVAGKLAERCTDAVPFWVGAGAMLVALAIFTTGRRMIDAADSRMAAEAAGPDRTAEERELEGAEGLESLGGGETAEESWEPARS